MIVTENIFGGIPSDLAAAIVDGMALSAELGDGVSLFQPSHGSAPEEALALGCLTADLKGKARTREMADMLCRTLSAHETCDA